MIDSHHFALLPESRLQHVNSRQDFGIADPRDPLKHFPSDIAGYSNPGFFETDKRELRDRFLHEKKRRRSGDDSSGLILEMIAFLQTHPRDQGS